MVGITFTLRLVALHKWRSYGLSLSFFCSKKVQVQFYLDSMRLNFDAYCNFIRQGVYNPYGGQQYLPIYGVPGSVNTTMYPYGQLSQAVPGSHSYTTLQGYAVPGHQILQFGGPSVNAMTASSIPTIQAPYPTGTSLLFVSYIYACIVALHIFDVNLYSRCINIQETCFNLIYFCSLA